MNLILKALCCAACGFILGACGTHTVKYTIKRGTEIIHLHLMKNDLGGVIGDFNGGPFGEYKEIFFLTPISQFIRPGDVVLSRTSSALSSAGGESRAAASSQISPSTTLFGIGENGVLLEFETSKFSVVRSLSTSQNLRTGITSPQNRFLYLASTGPLLSIQGSVKVVNLDSFTVTATIPLPADALPNGLAVTPDGAYLYIAAAVNGPLDETRLYVADTTRNTVVKTLVFPGSQGARSKPSLSISPDGGLVFFAVNDGIAVIDVLAQEVSHTIRETSAGGVRFVIDPTGSSLYVAPAFGDRFATGVAVYDVATAARVNHFPIKDLSGPIAMTLTLDGASLAIDHIGTDPVTQRNGPITLTIVDAQTGKLIAERSADSDVTVTVGQLIALPAR